MTDSGIFLIIGVTALVAFAIQTLISFMTGHDDVDGFADADQLAEDAPDDGDEHHGPMQFFSFLTIRNLIAFTLGFGWVGYASTRTGFSGPLAVVLGTGAGLIFAWTMYKLMKVLHSLESDATVKLEDAIGQTAEVYLEISENSPGKVMIQLGGALMEMPAVSPHPGLLARGTIVRVIDCEGKFLTVERA